MNLSLYQISDEYLKAMRIASPFPAPLKDRIRLAKEHVERYGQQHDSLWPHQRFAMTVEELLDAAERGA